MEEKTPTLKERYGYVYKVIHIPSGEYYIGQKKGTSPETDNYLGSGSRWQNKLNKYPISEFKKEVLDWAYSQEELNELEDKYIKNKYEEDPLCWNLVAGGHHPGASLELRKKLSESHKGIIPSEETLEKRGESLKEYWSCLSGEEKEARLSKWHSNQHKWTEEEKAKMSQERKGKAPWNKDKECPSLSAALKGRKRTEESKKKQSQSLLGYKRTSESRKRQSETIIRKNNERLLAKFFLLYASLESIL